MATDTALARGAYMAAGGGIEDYGLAASKGMTAIGKDIGSRVSNELDNRRSKFNEFAEWELTRTPGMTDAEVDDKAAKLMEMKSEYMLGDNISRAKIMRHMSDMKSQQQELDEAKKTFAEAAKNKDINSEFAISDEGQLLIDHMKNGSTVWQDGVEGYLIDIDGEQKFYDSSGLLELVKQQSFDTQSSDMLHEYARDIVDRSKSTELVNGKATQFDWDAEFRKVKGSFVRKGTPRSLAKDEIIPGRTFYDDFMGHLQEGTYSQLGVTMDVANQVDPNTDGDPDRISPDDAQVIVDALLDDEDLSTQYLANYYTRFLEQNWNGVQNKMLQQTTTLPQNQLTNMDINQNTYQGGDI